MNFYEGVIVATLVVNAWGLWRLGKAEKDIEMLYDGLAMCMSALNLTDE